MAVCVGCGQDFEREPVHATCPRCGTAVQVWVGHDGKRHQVSIPPVTITTESNEPDGSRTVTTGSFGHHSTSTTSADGEVASELRGRPARGEENVLQACESVMEAMKLEGREFNGKFKIPPGPERGVDAVADLANGTHINVQVVGVSGQDVLRTLGSTGVARDGKTADVLADEIVAAVVKKGRAYPPAAKADVELVVDSTRSPGHLGEAVAEALREAERSAAIADAGFAGVWLSGPANHLTRRLH